MFHYPTRHVSSMANQYGGDGLPEAKEVGVLRFELALHLLRASLPSNLFSGDRNSMAHGIECRYPFLDYDLVDFTTRLPDWAYLDNAWGKAIMRTALSDRLPHDVLWRVDKVGFAAPQDRWLASPAMKEWLEERVFDQRLKSIPGYDGSALENVLSDHLQGKRDRSATLWQWASAAELLDMQAQGEWAARPKTQDLASLVTSPSELPEDTGLNMSSQQGSHN